MSQGHDVHTAGQSVRMDAGNALVEGDGEGADESAVNGQQVDRGGAIAPFKPQGNETVGGHANAKGRSVMVTCGMAYSRKR